MVATPPDGAQGAQASSQANGAACPVEPDPDDAAAVVAHLVSALRAAEKSTRPVEAMRPTFVALAATLADTSPEWAELWTELKSSGVALIPWRKAVRAIVEKREAEATRAHEREVMQAGTKPGASAAARIALIAGSLQCSTTGLPKANAANLLTVFARDPRWEGRLAYHALREAVITTEAIVWHQDDAGAERVPGEWTEQDSVRTSAWLSRFYDLDASSLAVTEAIETAARKTIIDPVRDYFGGLKWGGRVRLLTWLHDYLGAPSGPYAEAVGARWLISGVARALEPGSKVDCVLVLEGKQGTGKSTALRALCHDPTWFYDDELEIGNAQAAGQALRGKTLIELGELSALSRHELAAVKSFITRRADTYRPSFGRRSRDFPRRCVFAGSTNEEAYLSDDENRRFWPVRTGAIDVEALLRDRDQLWAEAVVRYQQGEPWHVDTPELAALCAGEQERRAKADPWETWIGTWLEQRLAEKDACRAKIMGPEQCDCATCAGVTTAAVLLGALSMDKDRQNTAAEMRAAGVLRRLGWVKRRQVTRAGVRVRPFYPSLEAAQAADLRADQEPGTRA